MSQRPRTSRRLPRDRERFPIGRFCLLWKRSSGIASSRAVSRAGGGISTDYDKSVFINCPFDDAYLPLFRALVFAVFECGLNPRCAQEVYDAEEVRIEKIIALIRDCRWGIHDISRTDLNLRNLPRFNMPLEPGLFLDAKRGSDPVRSGTSRASLSIATSSVIRNSLAISSARTSRHTTTIRCERLR